jgi:phosphohistidine phosphatase SixA
VNALASHPKFNPTRLSGGGYVLYFRHASAETGKDVKDNNIDDWWRSTNPALTRQLDDHGISQALNLGKALRDQDIKVDEVVCSEFRRTENTAFLMGLGDPQTSTNLTPLAYDDSTLPERIEEQLNHEPDPGTNTVLVAHGHVIPLFEELEEGDAAVFDPNQDKPEFMGFIDYEDWNLGA